MCECGCGQEIPLKNKYVSGHNLHNMDYSKRSKRKKKTKRISILCKCGCGIMTKKGNIFIHGHNRQGTFHTEDEKKRIKETNLKTYADPNVVNKFKGKNNPYFGIKHSDDIRLVMQTKAQERCKDLNFIKKISFTTKEALRDPVKRKKISDNSKAMWRNPLCQENLRKGFSTKPNREELFLGKILDEMYPKQWKYTGDFSFMIGGKCPDFVNCNGQKKIIEYNGTYWHKNDIPGERERLFAEFGYDTLIIWDVEIKCIDSLKSKIERFCNYESV